MFDCDRSNSVYYMMVKSVSRTNHYRVMIIQFLTQGINSTLDSQSIDLK